MRGRPEVLLIVSLVLAVAVTQTEGIRCRKTPTGVTSPPSNADGRFVIEVSGNPRTYEPRKKYTIFLRGVQSSSGQEKFTNFLLIAEQKLDAVEFSDSQDHTVGNFQLFGDTLTVFNDNCPNSISETNSLPKTDVQVLWIAPPTGSGCVIIKATVMESTNKWYSESGPLTKELCEEERESDDVQPKIIKNCCACDEAKYEVAFEGLWSRNTHPKDFPDNKWLTRFSDIIGASHSIYYKFWDYEQIASDGLKELAENGNTKALESELKAKSNHIRTIIKARGISHPNTTARTFAVFRVDNEHHLMSLVSMIQPSPDWFVGVSGLELCLENCSWIDSKTFNLYPWDAGTDDGITYVSEDKPSYITQNIKSLQHENNTESPFFDESGSPLKPLARLILSRQRLYEKHCDDRVLPDIGTKAYCEVTDWGKWHCTAYCGSGMRLRQRAYLNKDPDYLKQQTVCKEKLTERSVCKAQRQCRDDNESTPNSECKQTDWGEWSSCSATCGNGTRTRSRRYKNRNAAKMCPHIVKYSEPLEHNLDCNVGDCESSEQGTVPDNCLDRKWSEWSPCSSTCGKGFKVRVLQNNSEGNEDECSYFQEKVECRNDDRPKCDQPDRDNGYNGDIGIDSANQVIHRGRGNECILSEWSKWTQCDCSTGLKYKTRTILQESKGKPCKKQLRREKRCNSRRCKHRNVDCKLSDWTNWSPCTQSCGPNAVQQRTRAIVQMPRGNGKPCDVRLEKKPCYRNACLDINLYD